MSKIVIKPGRDDPIRRRHPWIFSGSIAEVHGGPGPGDSVEVYSAEGEFLAWASYSPHSKIRARVWSWAFEDKISIPFLEKKILKAINHRRQWIDTTKTNAYRLVHSESDGLPGLIIDRYSEGLVIQILSAGIEQWREAILDILQDNFHPVWIFERSDVEVRRLEGMPEKVGLLRGERSQGLIPIKENGQNFLVDIEGGQKTGFYLDQRLNRAILQDHARDKSILNCFSYSGAFGIYGLIGGAARVISIDTSEEAIAIGKHQLEANSLSDAPMEWVRGDVFHHLRLYRDQGQQFDIIILDPPKFAPTAALAQRAARGYKDINLLAMKLLAPGGLLFTFSCSGGIDRDFFQKILAGAAVDAKVRAQIVRELGPGPDHPVSLNFPEGNYLKGFILQVD